MVKCSFTGEEIAPGTGHMHVKKDGTVLYFKNSKAKKAMLERGYKARVTPWSQIFRALKGKVKK
ncbi:MAG: 50S ribosomal protein L24e [Nanoarchaeota archaeon]|nr:50S ribosomal protein L24e [Nanoarchaeota archaeon]